MATELKTTLELDIQPFLDAIKKAANNLKVLEELRPKFNTTEFQKLQGELTKFKPEINVALKVDKQALEVAKSDIATISEAPIDLQFIVNSEEIQRSVNRIQELRSTALTIPKVTNLNVDTNTEQVITALQEVNITARQIAGIDYTPKIDPNFTSGLIGGFKQIEEELNVLGKSLNDIPNFNFDIKSLGIAKQYLQDLEIEVSKLNKQSLKQIFPGLAKNNAEFFKSTEFVMSLGDAIKFVQDQAAKGILVNIDVNDAEKKKLLDAEQILKTTPNAKNIKIDILGEERAISDLNKIQKEVNDISNQKNIKVNVDKAGLGNVTGSIQKASASLGGFSKQFSSGLLASFSGAAVGAAVASFATQSVRAIGQSIKSADALQDSLRLAFTQVGIEDIASALDQANRFALDLSTNFGISAERSKLLLAQVVGLTGEFGGASENITKAALGIEEATGGLVKAEQAAKLFSRSIGNPEDQAALETLAKRFPAIGDAIRSTTDPAERANAVLQNLSGTFLALQADANDLFSVLQRLGDTFNTVFGAAFAPIADALAPTFQGITDSLLANTDSIAAFGEKVIKNFIEPLLAQLEKMGPSFDMLLDGLSPILGVISGISFDILITALQILDPLLQAVGGLFTAISPVLQKLGDIVSGILAPVFQLFNNELYNSLDPTKQLTDNVFTLSPIMETLGNIVALLNPLLNFLGNLIIDTLVPALQALEYVLGVVLLPFRALNFAFDLGKQLAADYGDAIQRVAFNISKYILPLIPPLFFATKILGAIFDYADKPINFKADLGDLTKIGSIPADAFGEQYDSAKKFNEEAGVKLPSATGKAIKSIGGLSKAAGDNTKAVKDNLSAIEALSKGYDGLIKSLEEQYSIQQLNLNLSFKSREAENLLTNKSITQYKTLQEELDKINLLENKRIDTLKILSQTYLKSVQDTKGKFIIPDLNKEDLRKQIEEYLGVANDLTTNVAGPTRQLDPTIFGINFDAKDPKSVEEARKVADKIIELYKDSLKIEAEKQDVEIKFSKINIGLDQQAFKNQIEGILSDINKQFTDLETGKISIAEFDLDAIKSQLNTIQSLGQSALKPFATEIERLQLVSKYANEELLRLSANGITSGKAYDELKQKLRNTTAELEVINEKTKVYTESISKADEFSANLGKTIEDSLQKRLQNLEDQQFQLNLSLNAEGIAQGLVQIELDFQRSVDQLQSTFDNALLQLQAKGAPSEAAIKQLESAQKNLLNNLAAQREIAIAEFRKQNDAVYAITESLRLNLSSALTPDNTEANKAFEERKNSLNNELELLKTNLELGLISYQDYNKQVLDLEKEKAESIKQYDDEVNQNKLKGFQKIADEALPAINNQLTNASAELTALLSNNASEFTDIANKSLETIGLVAAQSLGIALQQAKDLEQVQKLFVKTLIKSVLQVLQVQLVAAILQGIFEDVKKAGTLGLITGALLSGALTVLFLKAEAEILKLAGYEQGGYTGNKGTKDIAGVVHGQEFVVNAKNTKGNRDLLEWINKGNSADSFFARSSDININNVLDSKAINSSLNSLAYTLDSRLSSLETTVDRAIRQNATLTRSANQLDVSVYSDPGTTIKHMKKIGKIKGLS